LQQKKEINKVQAGARSQIVPLKQTSLLNQIKASSSSSNLTIIFQNNEKTLMKAKILKKLKCKPRNQ